MLGNQDIAWPSPLDLLDGTGFRWLDRETVPVTKGADSLGISGIDFVRSNVPIDSVKALPRDRFNVFLYHTPDLIEEVCGPGVDLYLCGHTHGGQVTLPWYGALITFSKFGKKYESGLYRVGTDHALCQSGPRPGAASRTPGAFSRPAGNRRVRHRAGAAMKLWTILFIAVGLAMDAFAVSVITGSVYKEFKLRHALRMALFFGGVSGHHADHRLSGGPGPDGLHRTL